VRRKLPPESFDLYVGLGIGRSYQQVARQYQVSKGTVTALAVKDNWQDRLAEVERRARDQGKGIETREQVKERHLQIARTLQAKGLEGLESLSLATAGNAIRALDLGVRQERLLLGEF
jgi:hypothetical protein